MTKITPVSYDPPAQLYGMRRTARRGSWDRLAHCGHDGGGTRAHLRLAAPLMSSVFLYRRWPLAVACAVMLLPCCIAAAGAEICEETEHIPARLSAWTVLQYTVVMALARYAAGPRCDLSHRSLTYLLSTVGSALHPSFSSLRGT